MYALNLNKTTKRVLSATALEYAAPDAVFVDYLPSAVEDYNKNPISPIPPEADLHNYLYIDGYIYDPLPLPDERAAFKATRNITSDELITINGVMYKAIANIPNGAYIIEGQNAVKTTIEAELLALQKGE